MRSLVSLLGALGLALFLSTTARGQVVWSGLGADDNWSTDANWGGTALANDGTATIQFAGSTRPSPYVDISWSIAGLAFNSGADAFTLNGSNLTIGSGGISNYSSSPQTINNSVTLGAAQTLSASAGNLTVGGSNSVDNGGFTLTADAAFGMTLALPGSVYGEGGLTKTGDGTVNIGYSLNDGSITGAVQVLGGTLYIGGELSTSGRLTISSGAIFQSNNGLNVGSLAGGGALTVNGELAVGSDNTSTVFSGTINDRIIDGGNPASVTKTGFGTLTLSGINTYSGGTTITGGLVNFSSDALGTTGRITLDGGGLQWASDSSTDISLRLNPLGSGGATFDTNGNNVIFSIGLSGADVYASLIKQGGGTLTLSAANTYTGSTTVNGGTLSLDFNGLNAPLTDLINSNSALVLGGGTLSVLGKASSTSDQSFSDTYLDPGASAIAVASNGGTATLNLGTIYRNTGATVDFTLPSSGNITTANSNGNGILGGWATVNGTDWATVSSGNIAVLGSYTANTWGNETETNTDVTDSSSPAPNSTTNSLRFNASGPATLTLSGTNTITSGGILVTLNVGPNATAITGGTLQAASENDLVVIQNNPSGSLTIGSIIAGDAGLTKSGAGLLALSGVNTYTGGTYLNAGTLQAGAANVFGYGTMTINGSGPDQTATLDLNGYGQTVYSLTGNTGGIVNLNGANLTNDQHSQWTEFAGQITGNGSLTVQDSWGDGTLVLSGKNNTYTGGTTINAGVLSIGANGALGNLTGSLTFNGGTLQTSADITSARAITLLNNGGTIDVFGKSSEFAGTITGGGALTVVDRSENGNGLLTLSHANDYTGGTTVDGSNGSVTLAAGASNVFGTGAMTVYGNGYTATLDLGGYSQTIGSLIGDGDGIVNLNNANLTTGDGSNTEFQGTITGTGNLVKEGAGTFTLSASNNSNTGNNDFVGTVSINAGTLAIYDDSDLGNATNGLTFNGGTLQTYNGVTSVRSITLNSSNGTIDVAGNGEFNSSNNSNFNGRITGTGSLTVTDSLGGGKVTLGYAGNPDNPDTLYNTYSGGTFIDGNSNYGVRLQAGAENVLGTGRVSMSGAGDPQGYGAILNLNGWNQTIGSLEGDSFSNIRLVGAQLTTGGDNSDTIFAGTISDTVGQNAALPGSLIKTGNGILTLSGANIYSGGTTVNGGKLVANGGFGGSSSLGTGTVVVNNGGTLAGNDFITGLTTINSGGHLAPGDPIALTTGELRFDGGLTLVSGAIFDFKLGTVASDLIRVSGGALISSGSITLNLSDAGDFNALTIRTYTLFDFSNASSFASFSAGDFTIHTLLDDTLSDNFSLNLIGSVLDLTYTPTAVPEPATYAALFGLAALAFAAYRRRHRKSV